MTVFCVYSPLRVELQHALLHAQIYQVGVYLTAGLQPQLQADLHPRLDQRLDHRLVKVVPLTLVHRWVDGVCS